MNLREIAGSACRCIYKQELLKIHAILFPTGLPLSEDRIFNLKSMGNSEKFYYLKKAYYNRYVRTGSAVNKYYPNLLEIANQYRKEVLNAVERFWNTDKAYRQAYNQQFLGTYMSVVYNLHNVDCPLKMGEKRIELKELVSDQNLIETLEECDVLDWKSKLLECKQVSVLLILGKLYQLKQKKMGARKKCVRLAWLCQYITVKNIKRSDGQYLNQTYTDFEFIIINDGSQDKTKDIIFSYNDCRIIYLENEVNQGIVMTLNRGIDASKGKYIARFDADDIAVATRLEKQVLYMDSHEEVCVLGTGIKYLERML